MSTKVKPIPEGYSAVTPYLIARDAAKAIAFYEKVFGATVLDKMADSDGKVRHAELRIGDARIMLADEHPEMKIVSPQALGGSPVSFLLYVEDVDSVAKRATDAGMKTLRPLKNQFYGDRSGTFEDPFGHTWTIATHVEDLTPEEMKKRAAQAMGG